MDHILRSHDILKTDFVRGEGCWLYDSAGRAYLDFEAGTWAVALGYCHPRVNQAIHAQIERVANLGVRYPSDLAEAAALAVLDIAGFPDGKCVFLSSGSEAVEFGVQVARRTSGRPLLLTLADSYLSAYGSASRKNAEEWAAFDWSTCAGCAQSAGCDPDCPRLAAIPFEQICGFVFEPGNAHGLVHLPPAGPVRALAERVQSQQGLVVVNEVTTGMGRTGAWFGFQHYPIQPDVLAAGKGLGNGYPVSVCAMRLAVAEKLEAAGFYYAQSHQNDPLGSAVASEVIRVMREEGLVERSRRVGEYFLGCLNELAGQAAQVKEVRGRGLMIVMELHESTPAAALAARLRERGFVVGYSPWANLVRFYPALVVEEEQVDRLVRAMGEEVAGG